MNRYKVIAFIIKKKISKEEKRFDKKLYSEKLFFGKNQEFLLISDRKKEIQIIMTGFHFH